MVVSRGGGGGGGGGGCSSNRVQFKVLFTYHLTYSEIYHASPITFRPDKGETRNINVEKSSEPLGIKIDTSNNGGIFVSSVNDNSLARKAGVQIGDQLLEVCKFALIKVYIFLV